MVDAYMSVWNEPDVEKRNAILAGCWADGGTYTDPVADVTGREALSALVDQVRGQFPGASIVRTSGIDEHHGRIRFAWKLQLADGSSPTQGIDVGLLAPDGRLQGIIGFWGTNPPAS
jgi:hypothetical protein